MPCSFHVVNCATGAILSSHGSLEAAEKAMAKHHRRMASRLNRPGLHGGINPERFLPLGIEERCDGH